MVRTIWLVAELAGFPCNDHGNYKRFSSDGDSREYSDKTLGETFSFNNYCIKVKQKYLGLYKWRRTFIEWDVLSWKGRTSLPVHSHSRLISGIYSNWKPWETAELNQWMLSEKGLGVRSHEVLLWGSEQPQGVAVECILQHHSS